MNQVFSKCGKVQTGKGRVLATWSVGTLESSATELSVRALLLSKLTFQPTDVVSIDPFTNIPVLYWGLNIRHLKEDCPATVRFCSWSSPQSVLQGILGSGFVPTGIDLDVCLECGLPMPKSVAKCSSCGWSYEKPGPDA